MPIVNQCTDAHQRMTMITVRIIIATISPPMNPPVMASTFSVPLLLSVLSLGSLSFLAGPVLISPLLPSPDPSLSDNGKV